MDINNMIYRRQHGISSKVKVIVDSGGFQLATLGKYLNPLRILRFEEATGDVGMILDRPPYNFEKNLDADGATHSILQAKNKADFDKHMQTTVDNADIMYSNKETKMQLYGVIHGTTNDEIDKWYKAVDAVGEFDGWALASKPPGDISAMHKYMCYAYLNDIKRIHVFLSTSLDCFLYMTYINHYYLHAEVTMDSISFLMSEKFGRILNPLTFRATEWQSRGKKKMDVDYICDCPPCSHYRNIIAEDKQYKRINYYYVMNLHNLYYLTFFVKSINEYVKDTEFYENLVRMYASKPQTVLSHMQAFDKLVQCGPVRSVFDYE